MDNFTFPLMLQSVPRKLRSIFAKFDAEKLRARTNLPNYVIREKNAHAEVIQQ